LLLTPSDTECVYRYGGRCRAYRHALVASAELLLLRGGKKRGRDAAGPARAGHATLTVAAIGEKPVAAALLACPSQNRWSL